MKPEDLEIRGIELAGTRVYVLAGAALKPARAGAKAIPAGPRAEAAPRAAAAPKGAAGAKAPWTVPRAAVPLAVACAALGFARWGASADGVLVAGLLAVLAVIVAIDLRWRLVPARIVVPALAAVLAFRLIADGEYAVEWLLAAFGAPLILLAPAFLQPGSLGMGDVKLVALLGAALGAAVLPALVLGFLAVLPVALVLVVRGGRTRLHAAAIPLAPFLALGAAVALLA